MPETRGADLETTGAAFGAMGAPGDMPLLKGLRRLVGRVSSSWSRTGGNGGRDRVGRGSGGDAEGLELENRG